MKKLMLFLMWLAASATAVGVAWAGVSVVDNQVVDPPPAAEIATPAPSSSTGPDGSIQDDPISTATPTTTPTSQTAARPSTSGRPPTAPPSSQPVATTSSTTALQTPAASTQTFTVTGGTAAISFSVSGVEVLWATPNPGFDVNIEAESPGTKVEFRAEHHRSRLDVWWSGGPQHDIREEPRD